MSDEQKQAQQVNEYAVQVNADDAEIVNNVIFSLQSSYAQKGKMEGEIKELEDRIKMMRDDLSQVVDTITKQRSQEKMALLFLAKNNGLVKGAKFKYDPATQSVSGPLSIFNEEQKKKFMSGKGNPPPAKTDSNADQPPKVPAENK
jgi:hypothetical protein